MRKGLILRTCGFGLGLEGTGLGLEGEGLGVKILAMTTSLIYIHSPQCDTAAALVEFALAECSCYHYYCCYY